MSASTSTGDVGAANSDPPPESTLRRLAAVWTPPGDQAVEEATRRPTRRPPDPAPPDRVVDTDTREAAMRTLYERSHGDMVRFAAFLCGDADAAEDIAQEAFVQVFRSWDNITDHDRLDAYLRVTVVNNVRGRHRRQTTADANPVPHLTAVASAEDDALGRVGRDVVLAAVADLPLKQRASVVMRYWMRMTESEIAADLNISVGSVRTHIKRGTKTLEQRLGRLR
jgi:RNA polymerase sigma-70 factor (sigma-E family)